MSDLVARLRDADTTRRIGESYADTHERRQRDRNEAAAEIERLRAALREHACECVSVCMDAKHNYGEIDTPDTCKYGRAALALAQEKPND